MRLSTLGESATRFLLSPANWLGLAFAISVLGLVGLGWISPRLSGLALLAYGAGFMCGGLWLGWPRLAGPDWGELTFADSEDTREATRRALAAIRRLVNTNPDRRLSAATGTKLLNLCDAIEAMLAQWEGSKVTLSIEDTFHARYIALRYLPDALKSFWSIPAQFATTKALANGMTAEATLAQTVDELGQKVTQLNDALVAHDVQAFVDHSQFLSEKFGRKSTADSDGPVALK